MRKAVPAFLFLLVCVMAVVVFADAEQAKLHPYLQFLIGADGSVEGLSHPYSSGRLQVFYGDGVGVRSALAGGSGLRIGVLVKVRRPVWMPTFLGLPVFVNTGSVLGMRVTLAELWTLVASTDVVYVEPAWKTEPKLDRSLSAIGVDLVHREAPPVLGEGVIVGVVDTGIDYAHLDFRVDSDNDGDEESSRIQHLWDQTAGFAGVYYDRGQIETDLALGFGPDAGLVRQTDLEGHGTHVASVAAGDGSASASGYVGVAPEAELIVVKTTFYTSDILAGVDYIFERAEEKGFPAVVNLSLGGHSGPHDGTSLFEQGLDELAQGEGRIIVVSAGNEGDQSIHVSRTLFGGSYSFSVVPSSDSAEVSIWYPGGSFFNVTVKTQAGEPLTVASGDAGFASTLGGDIYVDNALRGANANNGDKEMAIALSELVPDAPVTVTVSDDGGGGVFDGWITSGNGARFVGGDSTHTIDEPGNARRVITVGAFNSKARWPSLSGDQDFLDSYPLGALSGFSSQGPTRDGRQKPDVAAPGAWVTAALSAKSTAQGYLTDPDGVHSVLLGTSVSAPHVSGVAALMLSVNPQLAPQAVKGQLVGTCAQDVFTGAVPNTRWGWGKVDADSLIDALEPPQNGSEEQGPLVEVSVNPARESVSFYYELPAGTEQATLYIYSVSGQIVFSDELVTSEDEYQWNLTSKIGRPLGSGLYLYVLITDLGRSKVRRLVIER